MSVHVHKNILLDARAVSLKLFGNHRLARTGFIYMLILISGPRVANLYTDLLATRQTILTCQDVANKSATSLFCRCDGI